MAQNTAYGNAGNTSNHMRTDEEAAFLRQKCNSLAMRGRHGECAKLIEDNLELLYFGDRWPENFFAVLRTFSRCYPALNRPQSFESYLREQLRQRNIPFVLADLLRPGKEPTVWNGSTFREMAQDYIKNREYETALSCMELALKIDVHNAGLYVQQGEILELLNRPQDAKTAYSQALDQDPGNLQATIHLVQAYRKINHDKALQSVERAIASSPANGMLVALKAEILEAMGRMDEAMECYDLAILLEPFETNYLSKKASFLAIQGDAAGAAALYQRVLSVEAGNETALLYLARYLADSAPDQALVHVNTLLSRDRDNEEATLIKGYLLRKRRNYRDAAHLYKRLLAANGKNAKASAGLGECFLHMGDAGQALIHFMQAVDNAPKKARYHMGLAETYLALHKPEEARDQYVTASELDANNHEALAQLGRLWEKDDPQLALQYLERAIQLDPENPYYQADKGNLLMSLGDQDGAMAILNRACDADPGNGELHYKVGTLLRRSGKSASAISHLRQAISLDPMLDGAYSGLAKLLVHREPDEALRLVNRAIDLEPLNSDYYHQKARILMSLEKDSAALERFSRDAKELGTNGLLDEEADALLEGGQVLRVALMYVNRAIELQPNRHSFLCTRGELLHRLGQTPRALEDYRRLLDLYPKDSRNHTALYGLGRIYAEQNDKRALKYYDEAIALLPEESRYYAAKADFLAGREDGFEQAVACYEKAIQLDREDSDVLYRLGRLLDKNGQYSEAMDRYRQALLVCPEHLPSTRRMAELLCDMAPTASLSYIQHAIALEPGNWLYQALLAKALFLSGEEEAAQRACGRALELGGGGARAYRDLANVLYKRLPRTALPYCRRALELEPETVDALLVCGDIYLDLKEYDLAQQCFEGVLAKDAGNHAALRQRAILLSHKGDPAALEAIDALLAKEGETSEMLSIKAGILTNSKPPEYAAALECLSKAVHLEPEDLPLRERYVTLLGQSKSLLRYPLEKSKLKRLRKKLEDISRQAEDMPDWEDMEEVESPAS